MDDGVQIHSDGYRHFFSAELVAGGWGAQRSQGSVGEPVVHRCLRTVQMHVESMYILYVLNICSTVV